MPKESKQQRMLRVLLRDFGYYLSGGLLLERKKVFVASDSVVFHVRSLLHAAELLCPIIHDPEFTDRLAKIHNLTEDTDDANL